MVKISFENLWSMMLISHVTLKSQRTSSARLNWAESCVCVCSFTFRFFFFSVATFDFFTMNSARVYCSWVPQITFFSNFFIKNGSHNTIYTFKNYFVIIFSVSIFNFSKNKLYSNGSQVINSDVPTCST